jgi:hypothetical protein
LPSGSNLKETDKVRIEENIISFFTTFDEN